MVDEKVLVDEKVVKGSRKGIFIFFLVLLIVLVLIFFLVRLSLNINDKISVNDSVPVNTSVPNVSVPNVSVVPVSPSSCGDGVVQDGENWKNCKPDLLAHCGDGVCDEWEHYRYCAGDCPVCIVDDYGTYDGVDECPPSPYWGS